jgi:WS/DGAT/MGAT family acyltransferase
LAATTRKIAVLNIPRAAGVDRFNFRSPRRERAVGSAALANHGDDRSRTSAGFQSGLFDDAIVNRGPTLTSAILTRFQDRSEAMATAWHERLSALDRSFLDLESHNTHMHVAGAFCFQPGPRIARGSGVDFERIRDYIAARLHEIPRYHQRIEWIPIEGHPVWVDDERFDIDNHVQHVALPSPGDETQLKRLCGRLMSQKIDRSKPLWEIWIAEGLEKGGFALVCKTHHCMIDGASGMDLLQLLLSPQPTARFAPGPPWAPRAKPTAAALLRDSLKRRAQLPLIVGGTVARTVRDPWGVYEESSEILGGIAETAMASIDRASDTPLNRQIGPHRRVDWLRFELRDVKFIKQTLGGTINDVVLAIVAGALGRFLEHRGMPTARRKDLDIRAFCPVSLRSATEHGTLGNRVSSMIARLPVGESDPRRRLSRVIQTVGHLKEAKQALGAQVLSSVCDWTVPSLVSTAARMAFRRHVSTLVVTNIPGPQFPLYLLDARLSEAFPIVPLFIDQGLGIALFSYDGGLFWGLNADRELVSDLETFAQLVRDSFQELLDAAGAASTAASTITAAAAKRRRSGTARRRNRVPQLLALPHRSRDRRLSQAARIDRPR